MNGDATVGTLPRSVGWVRGLIERIHVPSLQVADIDATFIPNLLRASENVCRSNKIRDSSAGNANFCRYLEREPTRNPVEIIRTHLIPLNKTRVTSIYL